MQQMRDCVFHKPTTKPLQIKEIFAIKTLKASKFIENVYQNFVCIYHTWVIRKRPFRRDSNTEKRIIQILNCCRWFWSLRLIYKHPEIFTFGKWKWNKWGISIIHSANNFISRTDQRFLNAFNIGYAFRRGIFSSNSNQWFLKII